MPAVVIAAGKGYCDVVSALVRLGADVNATHPESGATALIRAAQEGRAGIVEVLLSPDASPAGLPAVSALMRLGPDLDARTSLGMTALMTAAFHGQVECARALLVGGADRTLRAAGGDWKGKTALEIAEKEGSMFPNKAQKEMIRLLKA